MNNQKVMIYGFALTGGLASGITSRSVYNLSMDLPADFRPEVSTRRGEVTAWGLAILAFVGWALLSARGVRVSWLYIFLALFLLLSGLAISLTNWVERRTVLRLETDGVSYENGLRRARMAWNEIQRVQVEPGNLGNLVRVFGDGRQYFSFRTLGEVLLHGETRGRVGFTQGEAILTTIVEKSGLKRSTQPAPGRSLPTGGYYYARE